LPPGAGIKRGARRFDRAYRHRQPRQRPHARSFFGGRIIDGKHFAGRTFDPLSIDIVLISSNEPLPHCWT